MTFEFGFRMEWRLFAVVTLLGTLGINDAAPSSAKLRMLEKLTRSKRATFISGLPDTRVDSSTQQNIINRHNTARASAGVPNIVSYLNSAFVLLVEIWKNKHV